MKTIINGDSPTAVFKKLLLANPSLSNHDLAWMFVNEFPKVGPTANNFIWYWKGPARTDGRFEDALVDTELTRLMRAAGYL